MTRFLIAAALLQAAPAAAAGAKGSWGRVKYIGENSASTPPTTGAAADCLEHCGRIGGMEEAHRPAPAAQPAMARAPEAQAASAVKTPRRIGGFVSRDPAARRLADETRREKLSDAVSDSPRAAASQPAKPYSLWNNVSAPIEMSSAKVAEASLADAESGARAEYERRILGLETPAPAAGDLPTVSARPSASPGELFVSVDVAGSGQDALKDAVAGLSSAAGFRLDARFPPQRSSFSSTQAASRAATSVRGWLPAERLGAAVAAPGVLRVEVDRAGTRAEHPGGATTALVVGIRIPDGERAGESFRRAVAELSESARFQWTKTIGFEAVPNSKDVALVVVGELPLARLPKLLEHPSVIKVAPAPLAPEPPAAPRKASRLARFADYARDQAPLLVALTLLMLLPSVGGLLLRVGQLFIPYHPR